MGFENNPGGFLVMIVQTISVIIMWMIGHVFLGLYLGFGFFEEYPDWKNYVYYALFLVTLYFLVRYIRRKWDI